MIFPEGSPNRNYCVREIAASTVFTMLYIGALESSGRFLAPKHVFRMNDDQAGKADSVSRIAYAQACLKPGFRLTGATWYADTTREPIRDETLREGLMVVGAAVARTDLPTTSSAPRYALLADFARLFDPGLQGPALKDAVENWQRVHLSAGGLARIRILRGGAAASTTGLIVRLPNGEARQLSAGPSSVISKAVIETFAPRFLERPALIWLSESGNRVVAYYDQLAKDIGLKIKPDKNLPDIILVDLAPSDPILVFVEVVATDGPVTHNVGRPCSDLRSPEATSQVRLPS